MTQRQLMEARAYYNVEPWGAEIGWWVMAAHAANYVNANRKKGSSSVRAEDFLPKALSVGLARNRPQTLDQMKAMAMAMGAESKRGRRGRKKRRKRK